MMAVQPDTDRSALSRPSDGVSSPSAATFESPALLREALPAWPLAAGFAVLCVIQPGFHGMAFPRLWYPAAGIALPLVAWFGYRAAALPVLAGVLAALIAFRNGEASADVFAAIADGMAAALESLVGCWLFLGVARGARRLSDPRSVLEFLLAVGGVTAGLGGCCRLAVAVASGFPLSWAAIAALWLAHALGLLVLAPPLLVSLTPWLVRRGFTHEDASDEPSSLPGPVGADRLATGDRIEIAGLAFCAVGLGLMLALGPGSRVLAGWQVWGAPLLLIVWASLRQGLAGGTAVACAAVAVPLAVLSTNASTAVDLLLQGNLLAQAGTGLLVASSASWLRSSERRYRQLVAHVPVVVYSVRLRDSAAAEVTLVSAASAALLGAPPDQFLGKHERWLRHVHPEDREVLQAAITQLQRQDGPVTCEYRLIPGIPEDWPTGTDTDAAGPPSQGHAEQRPTRAVRWVRDTLAPRRDGDGRLLGWEGVVSDITEQRVLADDLRRASNMLRALVDNLPAGVFFVHGPVGQPILVNARARQLLGQREDAALARLSSYYRLHRPDWTPYPVEELPVARALRDGRSTMCDDIVVHRPDGRRVPLVTWAAPVQLSGTATDAAVWVLEDLTALRQAEAARHESEGRLRAVVETMGEALVVLGRNGEVVDANSAAADLFGSEMSSMRRRPLTELGWRWLGENGSPFANDEHPASITLRTGRPMRGTIIGLQAVSNTALVRWVLVNAMPLGAPPSGVVMTLSDLTLYHKNREAAKATG